jgi:hypothetical protein
LTSLADAKPGNRAELRITMGGRAEPGDDDRLLPTIDCYRLMNDDVVLDTRDLVFDVQLAPLQLYDFQVVR